MTTPLHPSLSTMWMQHRADRVAAWWEEVQALGFQHIELSHIVTPSMLDGLQPDRVRISSVPLPGADTTHPHDHRIADALLSNPDPTLRAWAVEQGRRSIDLAVEFGARAVCIHAGQVDIPSRLEWVLRQRYEGGYFGTPVYRQTLGDLLAARGGRRARAQRRPPLARRARQLRPNRRHPPGHRDAAAHQ